MAQPLRCRWIQSIVMAAALIALATAALAEVLPPPVPPAPSVKAVVAGDDGTLLFAQLRPWRLRTDVVPPLSVWWAWIQPLVSGTDLDLLGAGWQPDGRAALVTGGDTDLNAADVLRLPYPALLPTSILPDELKAGGPLRGVAWHSGPSLLAIWPPLLIDEALIAGDRTAGVGRLLLLSPGGAFTSITDPKFDGFDLWDGAWQPAGGAALAVGGNETEGVAFWVQGLGSGPGPAPAEPTVAEVYRGPGGPLKGVAFSPDGNLALMVGGQTEAGPAALARVLRFNTATATVTDLSAQAAAAGIEFRDVRFRPASPPFPLSAAPITPIVLTAVLAGGNTGANVAAAVAYATLPGTGEFSPLFSRPGPAINGVAFDRSGQVLLAACDQPAAGGNAPIIVASPGDVMAVDSGVPKNLRAASLRQVGEMVAWPLRLLPPILLPLPTTDASLAALSVGLKSSLVEGSWVHGVTVVARAVTPVVASTPAQAGAFQVGVWVVLDLNRNGIRDPDEPVLGTAAGAANEPINVPFSQRLQVPAAADAALLIGIEPLSADVVPPTGLVISLVDVLALGMESDRVLFVRGLPIHSGPIVPRLILKLAAWPNPFSPNGDGLRDQTAIALVLSKPAVCTLVIQNVSGQLVRTLLDHVPKPAGETTLLWDGKNDAGHVLPDGPYRTRLWAVAADGTRDEATAGVGIDTTPPVVSGVTAAPQAFSPNGDGRADSTRIYFQINEPGWVAVRAYRYGPAVTTIFAGLLAPGWHSVVWDGRAGGTVVPDGTYQVVVREQDLAGNTGAPASAPVVVDTQRPRIVGLAANPSTFSPNGDGVDDRTTISYRLSEYSRVFVAVAGQGLRFFLVNGEWQAAGYHSLVWNGLTPEGNPVPAGTYRVAAMAIDPALNISFIPVIEVTVRLP